VKVIVADLFSFILVFYIFDQVSILEVFFCKCIEAEIGLLSMDKKAVSSAFIASIVFGSVVIWDVNILYKSGDKSLSCETSASIPKESNVSLP